ncbi:MAG: hypothetical protein V8R28_25380 [Bacteroides cellulosilyticus]
MILFIKDQIPRSSEEELASSDSTTVMKLLDMQRFILFYEKVNLWGKAVYFPEFRSDIVTSMPAISQAEVLKLFVEPLLFLRERLPGEINGQSAINDCFFPSRDFPFFVIGPYIYGTGKIR